MALPHSRTSTRQSASAGMLRLALGQINATVGDISGNCEKVAAAIAAAEKAGAELVVLPELALTGYPPEDLLLRDHFLSDARSALEELARGVGDIVAVVGFPERAEDVHNAAAILYAGQIHGIYRKVHLPNYGVFDERRYFQAGAGGAVIDIGAHRVGVTICEDIWQTGPPGSAEAIAGAHLIVNASASPYHAGKGLERERMLSQRARDYRSCVAFCGLVGGQDELIFDGHSCAIDHTGRTVARGAQFQEDLVLCELDLHAAASARLRDSSHRPAAQASPRKVSVLAALPGRDPGAPELSPTLRPAIDSEEQEVYAALTLGLRDYVGKNGFRAVVLGLSGGIDSALVACLAADALGPERVTVAVMPSPYTSAETRSDAHALASALAVSVHELAIGAVLDSYMLALAPALPELAGLSEENLQARIRGNMLMALSNSLGSLVLATGNKSEMSVGYTTLYGDLAGGFAVIKDVPKTLVYRLSRWRNSPDGAAAGPLRATNASRDLAPGPIPESIIERPPSAELRPDQRDEDSLPPYPLLDRILRGYVELDQARDQLVAQGLPAADVDRTIDLVDRAEYKRRQAPPGIKITTRAFGRDRRMPITNRYRG